ncbi:50S ribosomal L3 [Gossypium arboreum]|uniref:50S ribosomal L3 n=1 Tax=Gossypium arboreum TaxID=29729 RepID=A0A0B0NIL5_GOSAR|nr:50S ribosomal L3 [Gossypium arboreum]
MLSYCLYGQLAQCWNFNTDKGFKAIYLNELKRMLEKILPHAMLKTKPNLESRIRTLKRD